MDALTLQVSSGNILVPIVAHVVYDLLTFLEVHQRATEQLERSIKGDLPEERQASRPSGCLRRARREEVNSACA